MLVHLVYPHDSERIAAPYSIGNNLSLKLNEAGFNVIKYDWQEMRSIDAGPNDILLGHPHPEPGRVFTDNLYKSFKKKIALFPFNGNPPKSFDDIVEQCDATGLICGEYWQERIPEAWSDHTFCLDMAIDRNDYKQIKTSFNPPGKRKFLYIGCTMKGKGTRYLEQIIDCLPDQEFSHMGWGLIPGSWPYGNVDFKQQRNLDFVAEHDFIISVGDNDANPTTMLESAAWGLVPICTQQCGWGDDVAIHVPFGQPSEAADILLQWQHKPEAELLLKQQINLSHVSEQYTWDKFANKIIEVIRHGT